MDKPRIFISSTHQDLKRHREEIARVVRELACTPVWSEEWPASSRSSRKVCLEKVRSCDLFLGMLQWCYGTIPDAKEGKSYTHLEYEAAVAKKIDTILFVAEGRLPSDEALLDPEDTYEKLAKLQAFKKYVTEKHETRPFNELTLVISARRALADWIAERSASKTATPKRPSRKKAKVKDPQNATAAERKYNHAKETYLQGLESHCDTMRLIGFRKRLNVPVKLDDLYVPLEMSPNLREFAAEDVLHSDGAHQKLRFDREVALVESFTTAWSLNERRGVVVLGDPGSGKTTQMRRMALWLLTQDPLDLGLPAGTIPIFLPLRQLGGRVRDLKGFVKHVLQQMSLPASEAFLKRLLDEKHVLFLFDGLDEVVSLKERKDVARWIRDLHDRSPGARFLVTCRYAGYTQGARLPGEFLELHLTPMKDTQVEAFVRNWYRIVETGLDPDKIVARERAEQGAKALIQIFRQQDFRLKRIYQMTFNPLLLTAICLVHRGRGKLPQGRADLYEECVLVLLENWREAKELKLSFTAKEARRVLQPMAYWLHQKEKRTHASAAELAQVLAPPLRLLEGKSHDPEAFLKAIRDESGILTGFSQDTYGFMHLGFQEYLAALEIRNRWADRDDRPIAQLGKQFGHSWWKEVTLLMLADGEVKLFEPLMREAMKHARFAKEEEFARMCLG